MHTFYDSKKPGSQQECRLESWVVIVGRFSLRILHQVFTQRTVVVIGGGVIGATTSYSLLHHPKFTTNDTLTLIEGTEIAAGASGKSGGFLALDWHGDATASLASLSFGLHEELAKRHGGDRLWGYRKLDTLAMTIDTKRRASSGSAKLPATLNWLNTGSVKACRTLGTTATTAQVHPRLFTNQMVALAEAKGAKVVIGRAVGLEADDKGQPTAIAIETRGGRRQLPCTDVVITAGPWSSRVATDLLGPRLKKHIHIDGTRAHSIVIKTHEPLSAHSLFCDLSAPGCDGEPEIYCRPDGTAYVCGAGDQEPLPTTAADVKVDPQKIAKLKAQSRAISPSHLGDQGRIEAEQACYLPVSRSGPPLLGRIAAGVYISSAMSCWGICLSAGAGQAMAELLLDGKVTSCNVSALEP